MLSLGRSTGGVGRMPWAGRDAWPSGPHLVAEVLQVQSNSKLLCAELLETSNWGVCFAEKQFRGSQSHLWAYSEFGACIIQKNYMVWSISKQNLFDFFFHLHRCPDFFKGILKKKNSQHFTAGQKLFQLHAKPFFNSSFCRRESRITLCQHETYFLCLSSPPSKPKIIDYSQSFGLLLFDCCLVLRSTFRNVPPGKFGLCSSRRWFWEGSGQAVLPEGLTRLENRALFVFPHTQICCNWHWPGFAAP